MMTGVAKTASVTKFCSCSRSNPSTILAPPTAETVHQGEWPFDREMFERALHDGVIEGRHSPAELPDEVDGYRTSMTRPRRHRLQYRWDEKLPVLGVIACNPSMATRRRLDDTLHLVVNQARLWGFGGIDQGNLDPVYETNSRLIDRTADLADPINMGSQHESEFCVR
ncbi:DUF1643 domain-containing protein [Sphingomonas sp. CFBP 13706]|uniref:DUF1643 domain-containing protein n=1 Tax=Sphingomonas sp. CFBP 13706 TaxID=2775314 RepID=UPI001A7E1E80|nr:DUF1643 domain-containing protein [Sphingomonas sp. CFBP 13706]